MKKSIFEKKSKPIKKGTTSAWSASHQLSIGPTQRDDRKDLEVLRHRCCDPSYLEHTTNRGSRDHVLRNPRPARSRLDSTLEKELGRSVSDHLSHERSPERSQITKDRDGL